MIVLFQKKMIIQIYAFYFKKNYRGPYKCLKMYKEFTHNVLVFQAGTTSVIICFVGTKQQKSTKKAKWNSDRLFFLQHEG